jgi:hypothetical protein
MHGFGLQEENLSRRPKLTQVLLIFLHAHVSDSGGNNSYVKIYREWEFDFQSWKNRVGRAENANHCVEGYPVVFRGFVLVRSIKRPNREASMEFMPRNEPE